MKAVITSDIRIQRFQRRWIERLNEQARLRKAPTGRDYWEGFEAYREVSRTRNLWFVLPDPDCPDYPFPWLMQKLAKEVHFYELFHNEVVPNNQCFRDALDIVSAAALKLRKANIQPSGVKAELDKTLKQCASTIEKVSNAIAQERELYWKDIWLEASAERRLWNKLDDPIHAHSVPPHGLVQQERTFEKAKYPRNLVKRIDLDTRFQVRVALILRSYLHRDSGISLRTISRLTLLTYSCGALGKEVGDELIVDGRQITVGAVDQKLRAKGVK